MTRPSRLQKKLEKLRALCVRERERDRHRENAREILERVCVCDKERRRKRLGEGESVCD